MKRRQFIAGLGSVAAWPVAVQAQQRAVPVVGILGSTTAVASAPVVSDRWGLFFEVPYGLSQSMARCILVSIS